MNVFICGQKQFGASVLEAIAEVYRVIGVSSPPFSDRLSTDGARVFDRLRATAERLGVPWQPQVRAESLPTGADLIVAAHSHDFIGRKTRAKARFGAIGYHPSLLPLHRGRDAVRWAVHGGDRITGGSVYWLTDSIDGGPIAAQQHVFIRPGETVETLWREQLAPLGVRLLLKTLADIDSGLAIRVPQDNRCATWEPSFDVAPLYRPELPQLGDGGLRYEVERLDGDGRISSWQADAPSLVV
jgi:methionyl-tRNA formyltransferase